jgi:TatD DNase family protein
MPELIDTHAHLDDEQFAAELPAVIERARAAGVSTMLAIGTDVASSVSSVRLAAEYPQVFAVVGIQPNHVAEAQPGDWDRIVELAGAPKVVGLGETGLDRYWDYAPLELQQDYFARHLQLSQERDLPFVVHTRESDADVLAMLREAAERGALRGVMHSFTGTAETAAECVALGMYISFAGMVTFKKSDKLRAVAATIPADRLLVETDSPYLSPHPLRGKRNEPAHVLHTATCLAETRGVPLATLAAETTANARRLFRLPSE